jgi:hypothetical protein
MTAKPSSGPVVAPGGVARTVSTPAANPTGLLQVEVSGGDGNVTALHDGGGPVLSNARIVLIYWGSEWGAITTNPSHADFTAAFSKILASPWGSKLTQYRGASVGAVEAVDVNTSSDAAAHFTDPEIWNMINDRIAGGAVPEPSTAVDRIYCVVMPTGHSSSDTPFVGQHQMASRNGVDVVWAWVTNDGTLTGGNSAPKIFTHEVAEACTNPDVSSGFTVTSDQGDEIGDVCNNTFSVVNGVAEEAYWSDIDKSCVLPIQPDLKESSGQVVFLRAHDVGTGFGPPSDFLDIEAVFILDSDPSSAFGFQLRDDGNTPARDAMFATLNDAHAHNLRVTVDYFVEPGKKNGRAIRVALLR